MSQALQFPKAYPKHKGEPTLTVYRFTIANRTWGDVLDCLESVKLPGVTITNGVGTWFNNKGELLTENNVTVETSAFTFDKVHKLIVKLLNHIDGTFSAEPEKEAYITIDGKEPFLILTNGESKAIT